MLAMAPLATHTYALDELRAAYDLFRAAYDLFRAGQAIKVLVTP